MKDLLDLITRAGAVADAVGEAREEAWLASVRACRALEEALTAALADEPLRALKNLGTNRHPLRGAQVRMRDPDLLLDREKAPVLVLDAHGHLIMAKLDCTGPIGSIHGLIVDEVEDEQLRAEDADCLIRTLRIILPRHIDAAGACHKGYARIEAVARAIEQVVSATGGVP